MKAFAPGSVTVVFAPVDDGSHGVSFATKDGVVVDVTPGDGSETVETLTLDGTAASVEAVEFACRELDISASIDIETAIPIGCGFGASGAVTLATVLAANAEFDLGRRRDVLVDIAARAEIAAATGLGDVYIQNVGGLVWNVGHGRERRERDDRLEYEAFGSLSTQETLRDDAKMARITAAGREALEGFQDGMELSAVFDLGWAMVTDADLATKRVRSTIDRVHAAGGSATMAMIGETVIATGTRGVLSNETRISPAGARVLTATD